MSESTPDGVEDVVTSHRITVNGYTVRATTEGDAWILQGGPIDAIAGMAALTGTPAFHTWTWPSYDAARTAAVAALGALTVFADALAATQPPA